MRRFLQSWKNWSNYFGEFYDASAHYRDDVVACGVFSAPSSTAPRNFRSDSGRYSAFRESITLIWKSNIKHRTSNICENRFAYSGSLGTWIISLVAHAASRRVG